LRRIEPHAIDVRYPESVQIPDESGGRAAP